MSEDVVATINRMIDLYAETTDALRAAQARTTRARDGARLDEIAEGHARRGVELAALLERLGGIRRRASEVLAGFAKGRVVFASLLGEDAIYAAMRDNVDDLIATHKRATARALPGRARAVIERSLEALARERAWLDARAGSHRAIPILRAAYA